MSAPSAGTEDDKPLDPAVEAVRRKLARLMLVSVGIMMVGIFAVLGAIVYKMQGGAAEAGDRTIAIPPGSEIIGQSIGADRIALRLKMADGSERLVFHRLEDGARLAEWMIAPAP